MTFFRAYLNASNKALKGNHTRRTVGGGVRGTDSKENQEDEDRYNQDQLENQLSTAVQV